MKSRWIAVALTVLLGAFCSLSEAQSPANAASSRLDAVIKSGTLRVCTTGDYKPYTFLRPDGQFEGIDIDLAKSLAASLGVKADFVKTTWPHLMGDFLADKCDIAVGGISVSLERAKHVYFSHVVMVDGKSPIARCADVKKYQTLAQLDRPGVRAIFNPGGTNEKFARAYLTKAHLIEYPDNVTIFDQIVKGKADVMVTDTSETLLQHKLHPTLCPVNPGKPLQYGEKAYMLPLGDNVFRAYVDQWLHLTKASGAYQKVVDKWLK